MTLIFLFCSLCLIKAFLYAHALLLSLKVNQEGFNPCTEAKQSKYQRIQEDVGGISVLLGLKKEKNPWSSWERRKGLMIW